MFVYFKENRTKIEKGSDHLFKAEEANKEKRLNSSLFASLVERVQVSLHQTPLSGLHLRDTGNEQRGHRHRFRKFCLPKYVLVLLLQTDKKLMLAFASLPDKMSTAVTLISVSPKIMQVFSSLGFLESKSSISGISSSS